MKLTIQKLISAFLSCVLSVSVGTPIGQTQSWYCKREKDHIRPALDHVQTMIEEVGGVYLGADEKVIYLTFDAGYENGNIARILDTLKKHEAEGAFFVLENLIKKEPDLICRMEEEGHLVCNHTARHKDITKLDDAAIEKELRSLEKLYEETTGGKLAPFFRPPEGKYNEKSLKTIQKLGYTTVFWSLAYADWDNDNQPGATYAQKLLSDNLHNGAVILLHPTSKTNADILDALLTKWKDEGYRFGSLSELAA